MKIRTKVCTYDQVMALPRPVHKKPRRPGFLLQSLVRLLSIPELRQTHFTYESYGMDNLGKQTPCLILMNHSCFTDLMIASRIFYPRKYGIVCTSDGFVGKKTLMRLLGCIPTQKFVGDVTLIRDMEYLLKEKKTSVLMYPEASYSFDGTATPLPRKLGVLLKKLSVPVVTVITKGAFARDPLYNCLQKRQVDIHADVTYLLSPEEIREKTVAELDKILDDVFSFDNFAWQRENGVRIDEPFRADGLNRILYRCPHCETEGETEGRGTTLTCRHCGKIYTLTETGELTAEDAAFTQIPQWYRWQRQQVRQAVENGSYRLDIPVDIGMMVDYKAIYMVGQGRLIHDENGFRLTGCNGKLQYAQGPLACYSAYADYYWYEIGDVICIGNRDALYYCFPKNCGDVVAKTRIAVEEIYKLKKRRPVKV